MAPRSADPLPRSSAGASSVEPPGASSVEPSDVSSGPSAARTRTLAFACLALVLFAGYVGFAFVLGESYPLSPLGMFSARRTAATRVVVRAAGGVLAEVTSFDEWTCDEPLSLQGACSPLSYSAQDERVLQHIRENPRSGAPANERARVELVRLIFRIPRTGAALETQTCPLATCEARDLRGRPAGPDGASLPKDDSR